MGTRVDVQNGEIVKNVRRTRVEGRKEEVVEEKGEGEG